MSADPKSSSTTTTTKKAPTESDVYDRQIRLWGAESQAKMQNSRVLYIHVTGLSAEVLKNLVLAGIAATLCDTRPYQTLEEAPHFLYPPKTKKNKLPTVAEAVQPVVEELNPLLGSCPLLKKDVEEIQAEDLKNFTVIMASQIPLQQAVRLSELATAAGSQFYLGDCFGLNGAAMIDLGKDFQYRPEQGKELLDPVGLASYVPLKEMVQIPLSKCVNRFHKTPPPVWVQYRCLLQYMEAKGEWPSSDNGDDEKSSFDKSVWETYLKEQGVEMSAEDQIALGGAGMAQIAPVCAVLGGMLGNEIIKVISGKGEPANNTLLLDGSLCKAWSFLIQKPKK